MRAPLTIVALAMVIVAGCLDAAPPGTNDGADDHPTGPAAPDLASGTATAWRWSQAAALPSARHDMACAVHEGAIWVMGGINGHGITDSRVDIYDPAAALWSPGAALPDPVHGGTAISFAGTLSHFGGYTDLAGADRRPTSAIYDLHGFGFWVQLQDLPTAMSRAAPVVADGSLYLIGGQDSTGARSDVLRWDGLLTQWAHVADLTTPRAGAAVHADAANITITNGDATSQSGEQWNIHTGDAVRFNDVETPRSGAASVALGDLLLVLGGREADGHVTARVDILDTATMTWHDGPPLPVPVTNACAVLTSAGVHVLAGTTGRDVDGLDVHWLLTWADAAATDDAF